MLRVIVGMVLQEIVMTRKATNLLPTVVSGAVGEVLLMALGWITLEPVDESSLGRSEG